MGHHVCAKPLASICDSMPSLRSACFHTSSAWLGTGMLSLETQRLLQEHIGSGRLTWSWGANLSLSQACRVDSGGCRQPARLQKALSTCQLRHRSIIRTSLGSQPSSMALEAPAMRMEPPVKWEDTPDLVITVCIQRERVSGPAAWCKLSLPLVREHQTRSPCLNAGPEVRERYVSIASTAQTFF